MKMSNRTLALPLNVPKRKVPTFLNRSKETAYLLWIFQVLTASETTGNEFTTILINMSLELAPHLASPVALFPICSAGRLTHRFQKENTDKWERSDGKRRTCGKENIEQDYLCSFDAFYLLYVITCSEIYLCCQVNSLVLCFGRSKF